MSRHLLFSRDGISGAAERQCSSLKLERSLMQHSFLKFSSICRHQTLNSHWLTTPFESFKNDLVSHLRNAWKISSVIKCSTPFGIIGIFTEFRLSRRAQSRSVLNAFRHHWNLHPLWPALAAFVACLCSTPFGIIGIFTSRKHPT